MIFGSLFTGIGGFDLGFEQAGMICSWQVENNPFCRSVLDKHWPLVYRPFDVRESGKSNLNPVDVICAGPPCVDLSQAAFGSHNGLDGEHSGLFYEMARIVNELYPQWLVIENVPEILDYLPLIKGVINNYEWEAAILRASDFGAYTRRERAFIVGYSGDDDPPRVLDNSTLPQPAFRSGGREDILPMCLPWKGGVSLERLGSCVLEAPETYTFRVREGDGISRQLDHDRWLAVGNAVPVPQAKWIAQNILATAE